MLKKHPDQSSAGSTSPRPRRDTLASSDGAVTGSDKAGMDMDQDAEAAEDVTSQGRSTMSPGAMYPLERMGQDLGRMEFPSSGTTSMVSSQLGWAAAGPSRFGSDSRAGLGTTGCSGTLEPEGLSGLGVRGDRRGDPASRARAQPRDFEASGNEGLSFDFGDDGVNVLGQSNDSESITPPMVVSSAKPT